MHTKQKPFVKTLVIDLISFNYVKPPCFGLGVTKHDSSNIMLTWNVYISICKKLHKPASLTEPQI